MHILREKLIFQFFNIGDFCDSNNGKASEVRINNNRLRVCITNNTDSGISFELIQFIFKFSTKISTFQIVD